MAKNNLFAPPSPDELALVSSKPEPKGMPSGKSGLFAPPSAEELSSLSPKKQVELANQLEKTADMSTGEALLHGAEQGVTAGMFDEAQGGLEGLGQAAGIKGLGGPMQDIELQKPSLNWEDIKKAYIDRRDSERAKVHSAQSQHPGAFLAGNIGGSLLIPGAGSVKGATALGAATGLGTSEADNLGGMAVDTGVGAATGFVAGKIGEKLGDLLTPEATQARASSRAVKALGSKPLPENLPMGKAVLDEGVLPLMGGAKATQDAITGRMNDLEQNVVQPTLDQVSKNTGLGQAIAGRSKPIEDIVDDAAQQAISNVPDSSVADSGRKMIQNVADYWSDKLSQAGGDPKKLNEMRKLIDTEARQAGAFSKFNPEMSPKADFLSKLRDAVNTELRGISSDVSSGAGDTLENAMGRQSALYPALDAADKMIDHDIVHPPGSITDIIRNPLTNPRAAGLGVAAMLHSPVAQAGMVASIGAEKLTQNPIGRIGNIVSAKAQNVMAKGLNTTVGRMVSPVADTLASRGLSSSGVQSGIQSIYSIHNTQLKQIADHFAQQDSTKNLGGALSDAITAGDEDAKNRVIFAMEQRPDMRMQLKDLLDQQKEDQSTFADEP